MSVRVLSAVWEESRAIGADLLVLLAMADWADQNGRCYPSYQQIAEKARVSRSSVQRAITRLIDLGEVARVSKGHAPTHGRDEDVPLSVERQWRNEYCIVLGRPTPKVGPPCTHISGQDVTPSSTKEGGSPGGDLSAEAGSTGRPTMTGEVGSFGDLHIGIDRQVRPSEELKAGAPPRASHPDDENPDDNLAVITRLAHDTLKALGSVPTHERESEAREILKADCARLRIAYTGDVVHRALQAALFQRRLAGASSVIGDSSGESAFRMQRAERACR